MITFYFLLVFLVVVHICPNWSIWRCTILPNSVG